MVPDHDPSCVIIEGTLYPKVRAWDRWVHRQEWLCHLGLHYFLPAGRRPGFSVMLCVCGRCGYSTWWNGNIWQLQIHLGYWKQAGHAIPVWTGTKQIKHGRRWLPMLPRW
jgi:hypothetical protein